jgi:predicted permease
VCLALGATRLRLARGVAVEGGLLAVAGAVLAIPIADWLFTLIATFQLPGRIEIERLDLSLDRSAWLMAAGGAVAVTWFSALLAGALGFGADTATALHARGGATARVTRRRTRAVLVSAQVAVTLVLVAGAGLFSRSLMAALSLNERVDTARIATGNVALGPYGYTIPRAAQFFDDLRERLSNAPDIASSSLIVREGSMGTMGQVIVDGVGRRFPSEVYYTAVDETYFATLELPILEGRGFSRDDTPQSPLVVVVSESFGRLIAGGNSPIGHRLDETSGPIGKPWPVAEIVGVVPDVITNVNDPAPLVKYYALAQRRPSQTRTVVVRATDDGPAAAGAVMRAIRDLDPALTPAPLLTLNEQIGRQMNPQRFGIYVLGALGTVALVLTVLGTYVLASSMAVMRRREMTIRASLGATGRHLGGLVLRETAVLVGIGLGVGLLLTWLGANTIRALLYRVEPLDAATLGTVSALILGLALAVSLRPALEAARVDFTKALREE